MMSSKASRRPHASNMSHDVRRDAAPPTKSAAGIQLAPVVEKVPLQDGNGASIARASKLGSSGTFQRGPIRPFDRQRDALGPPNARPGLGRWHVSDLLDVPSDTL
jgi:hypothetical protein